VATIFEAYWDRALANMRRAGDMYRALTAVDWDSPEMMGLTRVSRLRMQAKAADAALQARLRAASRDARETFKREDRARRIAKRCRA
jgi:hypothetical protein